MAGMENAVLVAVGRWSVGVQLGVVCLLALFFAALARTVKLAEVRLWATAWLADAVALAAVFVAGFLAPPPWTGRLWLTIYVACKTAYAFLLVAGARNHLQPGTELRLKRSHIVAVLAVWSVAIGFFSPRIAHSQMAQALMVGGIVTYGAVWVLRHPRRPRSRWLGWALLVEGLVFLHYVPFLAPLVWNGGRSSPHLRVSSFIDAGAELLLALAILVALEAASTEHLRHLVAELEVSQERLRQLVDHDPLTKLANRRALRAELERVRPAGAALVFLDIDDFKSVNDRFGHAVGDAALVRIGGVLARSFRSHDALFRWGGDEFLVVAPGLDLQGAQRRVAAFRAVLAQPGDEGPPLSISAGIALLAPGGEPDRALHEADLRMYADKAERLGGEPPVATQPG